MKIIMLMASATDSHYHKRYQALKSAGFDISAYGFERNISLTNSTPDYIELLPQVENGNYFGRIKVVYNAISNIISNYGKNVIYYATTFDIATICYLKRVKYIYGISDLVHSNFPSFLRPLFVCMDKKIIKNSICTILTSEGFVQYLNLSNHLLNKCIFVKNKLDQKFFSVERPYEQTSDVNKSFRFGFAGNIRYETILHFAEIIGLHFPQHKYIFWGNGSSEFLYRVNKLCSTFENIEYKGSFTNPEDLSKVYDTIDIMTCNYDTKTINERLSEPNKLYECIYFNKPLIVTKNTFLCETVKALCIGADTDNSTENLIYLIQSITTKLFNEWKTNESKIDTPELIEDYNPLFTILKQI